MWAFSGNYTFESMYLYDVNGLHRLYYANGNTGSSSGSGTHGFSFPDLTVNGPANDLDPPELVSVSVTPTTVDQDAGSITVDVSAQDASGLHYAAIYWANPGGGTAYVVCYFNGAETCTKTVAIDSSQPMWAFSGNYTFESMYLYDVNGLHRLYYANGNTGSSSGSGTHGFSFPDLTVN
jgi:hypothetical protein